MNLKQFGHNLFIIYLKAVGCVVELAFKVASGELKVGYLNPYDQNLNCYLLPVHIFYRSSEEERLKYQANSSCVILSLILLTTLFYKALILQGEI